MRPHSILDIFINPFYFMRRELWDSISSLAPKLHGEMLDIGCGNKPYEHLFTNTTSYIGMEFDSVHSRAQARADLFYDGKRFPSADNKFDSALSTEVLEHVSNPDEFLKETHRVLKPGGTLLLTVPFLWDEHEQPRDYARYSSFGIKHLLETHNFEIISQKKAVHGIQALSQLWNCYVYKNISSKRRAIRLCFYIVLTAPATLLGLILSPFLPKSEDLFLSNIVLARKI